MIFNVYQQFIRAKASAERVTEILNAPEQDTSPGKASSPGHSPEKITGHIAFDHVSFSYPNINGQPVLDDVSFTVSPRETLGIIGSTGSGKTSLIQLIPGFYNPTAGRVLLDGIPVCDYDSEKLREVVGVVAQTAQLFTGTIADNIRWGKADATMEEIVEAARAAQAHEFIAAFPDGYETVLGQNGVNLSGGQKQRVSIARAIIRCSPILIFDDCVSAVDVETESAILNAINRISRDLTCVMISQRVSSLLHLPKILVLDEGCVVGFGTHQELLAHCGVYQEICRSQLGKGGAA